MLKEKNITGFGVQPEGIEISSRIKEGKEFIFVMNHTEEEKAVNKNFEEYEELLSAEKGVATLQLEPFGVRIYVKK